MQANVYVDGLNLYYGAVRSTPYKWLDLQRLFTRLRPHDDIQTIYHFTALIAGSHGPNQLTYLRALETLPKIQIVLGKFKNVTVRCAVQACPYPGRRLFRKPEEKRTDVNVALYMARDAWEGNCEAMILVSGDSDIVPAVQMVKEIRPDVKMVVYVPTRNPTRGAAVELRGAADKAEVTVRLPHTEAALTDLLGRRRARRGAANVGPRRAARQARVPADLPAGRVEGAHQADAMNRWIGLPATRPGPK